MTDSAKEILLIARADDAGSARAADRAILEAVDRGIVRNVSLMAVGPSIEHAAELLAGRQDVCFGLHATLNAEWSEVRWGPVTDPARVPSLVEQGSGFFSRSPHVFLDRPPKLEQIMTELQAQLDRLRKLGFDVRYADSHMAFEWAVPEIAEPFEQWCEREGIRHYRRYSRSLPKETASDIGEGADAAARGLITRLKEAPAGQYLVVGHPGYDEIELRRFGSPDYPSEQVVADRVRERLLFTHPEVLACCKRLGVQLIRYDEAKPLP
ncbi:ChbG/HpnK family deacetylase [Cohnella zeiphila]|uniref:ChbG/HpnK family deacetylase n=1 Tax=Cohnella zeiphila TaxID=2761120 RepID=A0A7X0SJY7_9BACL|nr:ChbG/HpnK family deacetylase [Cohnella zeiphila]MBB6731368.1 ChbG/HpnK family deacetylase [Cohnella zeiphila]